jgi:hypothetical protein
MNMNLQSRIFMLTGHLRDARRSVLVSAIFAAVVGILIFLFGSYFFLFSYYEELHRIYYDALLRDIESFQNRLFGRMTYRDDMRGVAGVLRNHRGVLHVWFTDRYGKLIYHTDSAIQGEYRARRMPSGYYESIEHLWEFDQGYPVMHTVPLNWSTLRLSVPLYISGHEEHDFVMGMDVKRFLLIPQDPRFLALFTGAYFLLALAVLFVPTLLWLRAKLKRVENQAQMMAYGIAEVAKESVPEPPQSRDIAAATALAGLEAAIGKEDAQEAAQAASTEGAESAQPLSDEILQEQRLIAFLKEKRRLFAAKSLSLDFAQAHGYELHSKGVEGSYLFYSASGGFHLYACFSAPKVDPPDVYDAVVDIAGALRKGLKGGASAKDLLGGCNDLCRKKSFSTDVSVLLIAEKERAVEYSCSGTAVALYLKNTEKVVKELKLENPTPGTLTKDKFLKEIASADIKFSTDDLFCLVPFNAQDFTIGDRSLGSILHEVLVQGRGDSPSKIAEGVVKGFDALDLERKNMLPETGFVILKFL